MTDWEERYLTGETPWDRGAPSPGLVDFLRRNPVRGDVLVPGCGLGFDVRALAATADRVVGLDLAATAIRRARQFETIGGEEYVKGDLFDLPKKLRGVFDWVFEHTCFCAIDPIARPAYTDAMTAALKPGGEMLAVFYLEPGVEEGPPFGTSREELDELFGKTFETVREWVPKRAFEGREGHELMRLLART